MKKNTIDSYKVPLPDLLAAGCHFGHQVKRWNPKMKPFIWQARDGVHIFDLAQTAQKLAEACLAVKELVAGGGTVLFVGTKRQAKEIIKEEAKKINMPFIYNRWPGGLFTNWSQIKKSIDKLKEMEEKQAKGEYKKYTKKENILIQREINRLKKLVGGLTQLKDIPEAILAVDIKREQAAIKEAEMKGIKVFAIVDSNCDPTVVDYPIPGNDDAVKSIKLIVSTLAKAIKDGLDLRKKK